MGRKKPRSNNTPRKRSLKIENVTKRETELTAEQLNGVVGGAMVNPSLAEPCIKTFIPCIKTAVNKNIR